VNIAWIIVRVNPTHPPSVRSSAPDGSGVVAVVVTHDREALLRECLQALRAQVTGPRRVVVVDNASSDGTREVVAREFPEVELVVVSRNTGGAGGFTVGIEHAVHRLGAERVWLMDDDTIPTPTALEQLLEVQVRAPEGTRVLASRVLWTDGRDHPMNTPRRRPFSSRRTVRAAAAMGCVPIRSASFVSVLIDAEGVRRAGLPVADYFLWNDDFEYTARILRDAVGFQVTASVVEHRTRLFGGAEREPGPRFRYEVRNKIWLFRHSTAFRPGERIVYGAASVRRWIATYVGSNDRASVRRGLREGFAEGMAGAPRPNAEVLAGAAAGWSILMSGDIIDRTVERSPGVG